jgi:hypothetical protein
MRGSRTRLPGGQWSGALCALTTLAMLSGCLGAAVVPILASGPLLGKRHVHAATPVPKGARKATAQANPKSSPRGKGAGSEIVVSSLKELPAPAAAAASGDPWQKFFAFALASPQAAGTPSAGRSVLLVPNPPIDAPARRDCPAQVPAVVIDLDDGATPFDPGQLGIAPAGVATGLTRLRNAGIVVLWISQLSADRAGDVSQALRRSGLDPKGEDQLLLIRGPRDRKQLLRADANDDVCIIAMAGDGRGDFDELFDYLRHPEQAAGLDAMLDKGWFIVPPPEDTAPAAK